MAKDNKKGSNNLISSIWDCKLFKNKQSLGTMIVYAVVFLALIVVTALIKNSLIPSSLTMGEAFLYTILGIPIMSFIFFIFYYVFISAFEGKRKPFFEAYFVFLVISLPFLFVGHILNLLRGLLLGTVLSTIITLVIILLIIYYVCNLVLNSATYFNTTGLRVVATLILLNMMFLLILLMNYVMAIASSNLI